jgi:hypothetical protein
VIPGESPAIYGDALRRLASAATYLYADNGRYWYSTQPTVTKLADDRAELIGRDRDKIFAEVDNRLRADLRKTGDFSRVHPLPHSGQDVPDDRDARLVVLGIDQPYSKDSGSPAELAAKTILESRGNAPRIYRNSLVFLAADRARIQDLEEAVRRYLAWDSIVDEKETLNLSAHQVKQATSQRDSADGAVTARLPEAYQWLLVPVQSTPQSSVEIQALKLTGSGELAVRASKKLRGDELLLTTMAGSILRKHLDDVPLWRGDHVAVRQLVDDFARYLYLPRLQTSSVLVESIRSGLALLTWEHDSFAYAESYDESAARYRALKSGQQVGVTGEDGGLLVKPAVARQQIDAERPPEQPPLPPNGPPPVGPLPPQPPTSPVITRPTRYHGTVALDATRVGRDAGRVADEVIAHLVGLVNARVRVTLDIDAEVPDGVPENVVRIVSENGRTLRFTAQGFEVE